MNNKKLSVCKSKINKYLVIRITDSAKRQIRSSISQKIKGIKLSTKKSGCAGLRYEIEVCPVRKTEENIIYYYKEIQIYVSKLDIKILDGLTIDYLEDGLNSNFQFYNSKELDRCGCGESFNI